MLLTAVRADVSDPAATARPRRVGALEVPGSVLPDRVRDVLLIGHVSQVVPLVVEAVVILMIGAPEPGDQRVHVDAVVDAVLVVPPGPGVQLRLPALRRRVVRVPAVLADELVVRVIHERDAPVHPAPGQRYSF